jgi:hypothetical protein
MSQVTEEMLNSLEERLKRLEKAIPKEMTCPFCGQLLTIHEDYNNVEYGGTSHAQCYHCLKAVNVKETKLLHRKWRWPYWPSRNGRNRTKVIHL